MIKKMVNKERNSSIEILRIISMFLIVAHHFSIHGFDASKVDYGFNKYVIDFLFSGGYIGVNLFFLISAYFMVDKQINYKKIFEIARLTQFYSIFMFGITGLIVPSIFKSYIDILYSLFPIIYGRYWFISIYIIMIFLAPYLNIVIENTDKKQFTYIIIFIFFICSFLPTFFRAVQINFSKTGWMILLYFSAGYIKKYEIYKKKINYFYCTTIFGILMILLSIYTLNYLGNKFNISLFLNESIYFAKDYSPFVLLVSVSLFCTFVKFKPFYNKFINNFSVLMLGVYLIHDNYLFKDVLWHKIFKVSTQYESPYFVIYSIGVILFVFVACAIIEFLRKKLFVEFKT